MRHLLLISFLLIFQLSTAQDVDLYRLTGALLGETPIEENLQELCDGIGGRVTGSEANKQSVEWALKKFQEAGVSAKKQAFEMPVLWLAKATTAQISGGANFAPSIVAKYQSPPGNYSGKLIYVGYGKAEDIEKNKAQIAGNFLLVETDLCLDINGLFAEYAAAADAENLAMKHGAKGIVFMASRPKGLLYRFITSKAANNSLPQFVVAREDAKRCIRVVENGGSLSINVNIDAETGGSFTSHNVIGEIKGSTYPDEVIVIGAHLDSWALGTGANDNGCNVSMMIDIARQMQKLGIQPKRTIRFALWNGEEQGYFGSHAYTIEQGKKLDKHKMALSVDIGSGAIIGFFTNGREELLPVVDKVLQPVSGLSTFNNINAPIVGTDNFDFMLEGVPNLVANHKAANYGMNYHATSDTYDKVDLKSLKVNSAIIAALTLGFANLEEKDANLGRQDRAAIQAMFDQFDLEYTMRMFNVWEPWINGKRGRN